MVVVSALYPNEPSSSFDYDYFLHKHVPLVRERWRSMGLEDQRQMRGGSSLDGSPASYQVVCIAHLPLPRRLPECGTGPRSRNP